MGTETLPFYQHVIDDVVARRSVDRLHEGDMHNSLATVRRKAVSIVPEPYGAVRARFRNPVRMPLYPSETDGGQAVEKQRLFLESLHGLSSKAVFEIAGDEAGISCQWVVEKEDAQTVRTAFSTFFPFSSVYQHDGLLPAGSPAVCYELIPQGFSYHALTDHRESVVPPITMITQLFRTFTERAVYQVVVCPMQEDMHTFIRQAIDTVWTATRSSEEMTPPSMLPQTVQKEQAAYKAPVFQQHYAVAVRVFLPEDKEASVRSFAANFTYGAKPLMLFRKYTKRQVRQMLANRVSYRSGWVLNSQELSAIVQLPFHAMKLPDFRHIVAKTPLGDRPEEEAQQQNGVSIGRWCCGDEERDIALPSVFDCASARVMGEPRMGKSVLLHSMALQCLAQGRSAFVFDYKEDLLYSILRTIPKEQIDKVVVIDFGRQEIPKFSLKQGDLSRPAKMADDLTVAMHDGSSSKEKFWGPKMAYFFNALFYIYSVLDDFTLPKLRLLISKSEQGRSLRTKTKQRIKHPIIRSFLDEINETPSDHLISTVTRLSHLLLDDQNFRLFSAELNGISITELMDSGKLVLFNFSYRTLGTTRAAMMSGMINSLISLASFNRAGVPYKDRKEVLILQDEWHLGNANVELQINALAKYGCNFVYAHQHLMQGSEENRHALDAVGTQIFFKLKYKDAKHFAGEFGLPAEAFANQLPFQVIVKQSDRVLSLQTPKPIITGEDYTAQIIKHSLDKYYVAPEQPRECIVDYDTF